MDVEYIYQTGIAGGVRGRLLYSGYGVAGGIYIYLEVDYDAGYGETGFGYLYI